VDAELDIKELCNLSRVTPRTVHYYIQQGLLPPSGSTGPGARYTEEHLDRLRLIRLLQNEHLPLAEINRRLRGLSGEHVRSLLQERKKSAATSRGSALDYVRSVLNHAPRRVGGDISDRALLSRAAPEPRSEPALGRSQWERVDLGDGLELNVRRPLTRQQQRKLDKLLAAARGILEEPDV
jgi:DNA-binding transcriptional MerR regulator